MRIEHVRYSDLRLISTVILMLSLHGLEFYQNTALKPQNVFITNRIVYREVRRYYHNFTRFHYVYTWDWFFLISLICLLVLFSLFFVRKRCFLDPRVGFVFSSELRERVAAHRGHLIMIFHERHSIIYYQFIISSEHSKIQISSCHCH